MNILEALQTPELFGDAFAGDSWEAWRAVLSGAFALPMEQDRLALFKQLAGDREPPTRRVSQLWVVAGRRSAKTHTAAAVCVYLATVGAALEGLTAKLSAGETGVIALLATDRNQAKVALQYIHGLFDQSPVLRGMIHKRNAESLELSSRVTIEVSTSNYRAIRGRTLLACILDEVAFFRDQSADANDVEIYRAALPGLATTGGLMIGISSPWAKRGLLYDKYRKHYGQPGDILVVKGPTTLFNPTIDPQVIADALADDPESAKTEWLGAFREGISSYIDRAVVESCVRTRPLILPPRSGVRYVGFVDPAGGSSSPTADQFTMAIGYRDGDTAVICGVWGRRGSPADITADYAEILRAYGVRQVYSDRYAGQFPAIEFQRHGIRLIYTEHNRSQLYTEALPMLNTGRIELPNDPTLIGQICTLERRPGRLADIIDHAPGGAHDDLANSALGCCVHIANHRTPIASAPVRFVG
ncbi:hypothetical protein [Pseudomonas sp. OIL-1]|uniref:hypothetical protein n=1 Tax=Pseudomonas sp. OIL-1 TaxID=2706126 RepID=UPI0015B5E8F9|nr:hypothetical protein [Pseudomonas sp. OIL-1]